MKTNSDAPQTLYLGLDVHKEKTVIAILESHRDAQLRHYGEINTSQHALERAKMEKWRLVHLLTHFMVSNN